MAWRLRKADDKKTYVAKDLRTLQAWCRAGRAREEDEVQQQGETEWHKASHVFDLAAHFPSSGSPPPLASGGGATSRSLMTAGPVGGSRGEISLDLTSMMDMTFILLIFLMVIATPAFQHGMAVDLPQASAAGKIEKTDVVVSVSREGAIHVDKKTVTLQELEGALKEYASQPSFGKLILRADGSVQHARVVEVMDVISTAGIRNIAIATRPKQHD